MWLICLEIIEDFYNYIAKHCPLKQGLWLFPFSSQWTYFFYCKTLSTKTRIVTIVYYVIIMVLPYIAKHCPLKQGLWRFLYCAFLTFWTIAKHCPLKQGLWRFLYCAFLTFWTIAKHCPLKQGLWPVWLRRNRKS